MDRPVNFDHDRQMLCQCCGHGWTVTLHWIERWDESKEACPGCGVTCEAEDAPRVTVDPDDAALIDEAVPTLFWYHTSTHDDWPRRSIDPAARLTATTRLMMGGNERVAAWAERQRAKALHVGTYEAAIHNMFRRIDDQADEGQQFYLYRVRLRPDVTVRPDWLIDPSNFVGDVELAEVCPPGVDVARYLNYHEDPGGLSLALGRAAIASTQRVAIPLGSALEGWAIDTAAQIQAATAPTATSAVVSDRPQKRYEPSPQSKRADRLTKAIAESLPANIRRHFWTASAYDDESTPAEWAQRMSGLVQLISSPAAVLEELDRAEITSVAK
ncbi:hypothetical protein [Plantibacter sp. CFBP 8804]|uniref:hypothetical protein n=1 Tax=Plantibacter sp. CFBP 8804 TaxID=2775270 RepID=UPI001780C127|nr:hypothetical protein [Plantibacter sp. CFBP 8804]MBD8518894.1 hypothetical protein [Plantibacter sp. CFBP 8804]